MFELLFDSVVYYVANNILYSLLAIVAGAIIGCVLLQGGRVWNKKWRKTDAYLKYAFLITIFCGFSSFATLAVMDFRNMAVCDECLNTHLAAGGRTFKATNKDKRTFNELCEARIGAKDAGLSRLRYYARNAPGMSRLPSYDELDEVSIRQRYSSYRIGELPAPEEIQDLDIIYQKAYEYRMRCSIIHYKDQFALISINSMLIFYSFLAVLIFLGMTFHALDDIKFKKLI